MLYYGNSFEIRQTSMNTAKPTLNRPLKQLLAIASALLLGGCQLVDMARFSFANASATHQWPDPQQTTSVPFRLVDNHIILPVSVNGSAPLDFVLDSGAAATVIMDSRATRALHLQMAGELSVSGTGTGPHPTARIVPGVSTTVGGLSLDGQAAIFLPLDAVPFFNELDDVYFDGVIGAPFFERFTIEIDHDQRLVSFSEPTVTAQRTRDDAGDWREVALQIDAALPYLTARVDPGEGPPITLKLLVDTGFRGTLSLTPSSSDELSQPTVYFESVSQGLSGNVPSRVAVVNSLSLASYCLRDLPVRYAQAGGESQNGANGILGNEVLQQFNLVFDYARERLLLVHKLADSARRMHAAGINHRDFYLCHFHLDPASLREGAPRCYLIDLHRAQLRRATPLRWRIKDLAGLYFSALDCGLGRRDLLRFMRCYSVGGLAQALGPDRDMWLQVARRAVQLYRRSHGLRPPGSWVPDALRG